MWPRCSTLSPPGTTWHSPCFTSMRQYSTSMRQSDINKGQITHEALACSGISLLNLARGCNMHVDSVKCITTGLCVIMLIVNRPSDVFMQGAAKLFSLFLVQHVLIFH